MTAILLLTMLTKPPDMRVLASWYGDWHQGKTMANGKPFDKNAHYVAHRTLPLGTHLLLFNPKNKRTCRAIVTDRGPYIAGRELDVSEHVAELLGFRGAGLANLDVYILD
jgi:rare lipoprotein A